MAVVVVYDIIIISIVDGLFFKIYPYPTVLAQDGVDPEVSQTVVKETGDIQ